MTELQLPAHLANKAGRGLAAQLAQNLATGAPPHVSIKGNRFTLVDGAGNQRPIETFHLDVVIADINPHTSKIFYEQAYDPNASESLPPTCFSDNGVAPSSQAQKPQSQTCQGCPHNVWGSDVSRMTGKATKACNDVQKLAVIIPSDSQAICYLLRIPPASLKFLGKYAREVGEFSAGGRKIDMTDLVTRLSFDQNAVGILNFTAVGFVDERTFSIVEKAVESKATRLVTGADDKPHQGQLPNYSQATQAPAAERPQMPPPPAPPQAALPPSFAPTPPGPQPVQTTAPTNGAMPEPKKRGRPRKEDAPPSPAPAQAPFLAAAPVQAAPATPDPLEIPAFLQRGNEAPKPAAPQPNFGITEAEPVPDEMAARLQAAFNLPTR